MKEDQVLAEFVEDVVGSRPERPALDSACSYCREHNAILIIAELGRLVRWAIFTGLLRDAGVEFLGLDASYPGRGNIGELAEAAARKQAQTGRQISVALADRPPYARNGGAEVRDGLKHRPSRGASTRQHNTEPAVRIDWDEGFGSLARS